MNLKEKVIQHLEGCGVKKDSYRLKYFKQSPYQKRRYKPEFVQEEVWIFGKDPNPTPKIFKDGKYHRKLDGELVMENALATCILSEDFDNTEFLEMLLGKFVVQCKYAKKNST